MGISSFTVRLEGGRKIEGGGRVKGVVTVEADSEVTVAEIQIRLVCRTHGKGNTWTKVVEEKKEDVGALTPGAARTFRFDFLAVNGPASYAGHYVNIEWVVEAELDIAWKINPKATTDFTLVPNLERPYIAGTLASTEAIERAEGSKAGVKPIGLAIGGAAIAGCLGFAYWDFTTDPELFNIAIALTIAGAIAFGLFGAARRAAVTAVLGDVHALLEPPVIPPGGKGTLHVHMAPKRALELNAVRAELKCLESVTHGSGSSASTHRWDVLTEQFKLSGPVEGTPGQSLDFSCHIEIPASAPYSFEVTDNTIKWTLVTHVDIPRFPDWTREDDIFVLPSSKKT
jgi:SpoOM protein